MGIHCTVDVFGWAFHLEDEPLNMSDKQMSTLAGTQSLLHPLISTLVYDTVTQVEVLNGHNPASFCLIMLGSSSVSTSTHEP